jgi:F-type H+-transporting ATPase subunit beta
MLTPPVIGRRHYRIAGAVRRALAEYEELKDIIAMLNRARGKRDEARAVPLLERDVARDRAIGKPEGDGAARRR